MHKEVATKCKFFMRCPLVDSLRKKANVVGSISENIFLPT